jgi:hypothetical protein
MKRFISLWLFCGMLFFAGNTGYAQSEEASRGLYIEAGLGWGGIAYNKDLNNEIDGLMREYDMSRITYNTDIALGWAVLPALYVTGAFSMISDNMVLFPNSITLNTFLYGAGVRYYPLKSKKYLQLGLDLLRSEFMVQYSYYPSKFESEDGGFGAKISASYDLDKTMTGFSLLSGTSFLVDFVEDKTYIAWSFFIKALFK